MTLMSLDYHGPQLDMDMETAVVGDGCEETNSFFQKV